MAGRPRSRMRENGTRYNLLLVPKETPRVIGVGSPDQAVEFAREYATRVHDVKWAIILDGTLPIARIKAWATARPVVYPIEEWFVPKLNRAEMGHMPIFGPKVRTDHALAAQWESELFLRPEYGKDRRWVYGLDGFILLKLEWKDAWQSPDEQARPKLRVSSHNGVRCGGTSVDLTPINRLQAADKVAMLLDEVLPGGPEFASSYRF